MAFKIRLGEQDTIKHIADKENTSLQTTASADSAGKAGNCFGTAIARMGLDSSIEG
jgi:hypothetical protein